MYERIGFGAVKAAVNLWITKVSTDEALSFLAPFLLSQKDKQVAAMAQALGNPATGPENLWNGQLQSLKDMGLTEAQYNAYVSLFVQILKDVSVPADLADEAQKVLAQSKSFFSGHSVSFGATPAPPAVTYVQASSYEPSIVSSAPGPLTLYDKLGEERIRPAVENFYAKLLTDPVLKQFFVGSDLNRFKFQFLTFVFGDQSKYKGRDMRAVHAPMIKDKGLNFSHFETTVKYFRQALEEGGFAPEDVQEAYDKILTTKRFFEPLTDDETEALASQTLYSKLGETTIKAVVDLLYRKVMTDPKLSPLFAGVDMQKMKHKQIIFMVEALGGPANYKGKDMRTVHLPLVKSKGLTLDHFDAFAGHISTTLKDLKIPPAVADAVMANVEAFRKFFGPLTREERSTLTGNLYERCGGEEGLKQLSSIMYTKLTTDPRLVRFFEGYDVERLRIKVANLLAEILGGPSKKSRDLRQVHTNLIKYKNLGFEHFDMFTLHFQAALVEMETPDDVIAIALETLQTRKVHFRPLEDSELAATRKNEAVAKAPEPIDIQYSTRHFCATC